MLEEISISNLGVIKTANLTFTEGLTVISGETGAGKTMVLNALHLLLGRRGDSGMVREGAAVASAEGVWNLKDEDLLTRIEETGAVVEDGQVFINRTVKADGRTRAVVGGKSTPAGVLGELSRNLVNIHGQADQMRLKAPEAQLDAVDRISGATLQKELTKYAELYKAWRTAVRTLNDVKKNHDAREREYESLLGFMEEFHKVAPTLGELKTVEDTINALSNVDAVKESVEQAAQLLLPTDDYDTVDMEGQLRQAVKMLEKVDTTDAEFLEIVLTAKTALSSLRESMAMLESYAQNMDQDSIGKLHHAQDRLQDLKAFQKRVRLSVDAAVEKADTAPARIEELDPNNNSVEALEAAVSAALTALEAQSAKVTKLREKGAQTLSKRVNTELQGLGMAGTVFSIGFEQGNYGPNGADEVSFLLGAKTSEKTRPISKAASGGELSRIMLALEVVLADPTTTPTFVFDEVDSGVGGSTAIEIGKRLAELAKEAQVIVVTHLAQVAAFADNHLYVSKQMFDDGGETSVLTLSTEQRVEELTRMLSGMTESESGKAHAVELMEMAAQSKQ